MTPHLRKLPTGWSVYVSRGTRCFTPIERGLTFTAACDRARTWRRRWEVIRAKQAAVNPSWNRHGMAQG